MRPNPFSPSFSVHPLSFYGRKQQIERFSKALDTPGSAERCFFLTGTRGCGKTSLLHQYAVVAKGRRWDVVEATSADALDQLAAYAEVNRTVTKHSELAPSVNVRETVEASIGRRSKTTVETGSLSLLSARLCEKLRSSRRSEGLAIIIDEAQKISRDSIVRIGNAVQQARTEGLGIALVLGGLPNAYSKIRAYQDCTFLRRMQREELWCMLVPETIEFIRSMFAKVPEISISEEQVMRIGRFTGGHPYLIQLVGDAVYKSVERAYNPDRGMTIVLDDEIIEDAELQALVSYKENVLDDVLTGVHGGTRDYIDKAFKVRGDDGVIKAKDVAAEYEGEPVDVDSRRTYAVNTQVLKKVGRGKLRFALPHYEYAYREVEYDEQDDSGEEWEF